MRVATSQLQQNAVASMLDQQAQLNNTQQQISTGKRVLAPSDDPSASARILSLNQSISTTQQYLRNADTATSRLSLEDTALSGASDVLQRVRELAVQANNGTLNATDRANIAVEVRQLLAQLQGLANAKDASGEYLFAGFRANTQPFTDNGAGVYSYNGDQGQREVQIGPNRKVEVGDSGASVFVNLPVTAGGMQDIFTTLDQFATSLSANSVNQNIITDVDTALNSVLTARSKVGVRLNVIQDQTDTNNGYLVQMKGTLSGVQDVDYADATSRLNQQLLALQAAQQSYVKVQGLSLFNFLR